MMTNPEMFKDKELPKKHSPSFDESIPFIRQIYFYYGVFFSQQEERTITLSGDDLSLEVRNRMLEGSDFQPFIREFPGKKQDFLDAFASLHIGDWKPGYYDYHVLDGTSWALIIRFCNGQDEIEIKGSNAYPDNFADFYDLIKLEENDAFCRE